MDLFDEKARGHQRAGVLQFVVIAITAGLLLAVFSSVGPVVAGAFAEARDVLSG